MLCEKPLIPNRGFTTSKFNCKLKTYFYRLKGYGYVPFNRCNINSVEERDSDEGSGSKKHK